MKILLAIDGSAPALRATKKVLELAKALNGVSQIVPIHVHPAFPYVNRLNRVVGRNNLERFYREDAEKAVRPALKLLAKAGYDVTAQVKVGPIAETIASYAHSNKFDLICLGSRGMSASANLLMGSVASKILHHSKIPVLVVK